MTLAYPPKRKWTRQEYHQMCDLGFFEDQHVQLIDGEIVQMAPQKDTHAIAIGLVRAAVGRAFDSGFWIREQLPLAIGDFSEPEPDVSVIRGQPRDFLGKGHTTSAELAVEVSDTTLRFDQGIKASLYASANIADYWIVNLVARKLEVHRKPVANASHAYGFHYEEVTSLSAGEIITPIGAPGSVIAISDLLL